MALARWHIGIARRRTTKVDGFDALGSGGRVGELARTVVGVVIHDDAALAVGVAHVREAILEIDYNVVEPRESAEIVADRWRHDVWWELYSLNSNVGVSRIRRIEISNGCLDPCVRRRFAALASR